MILGAFNIKYMPHTSVKGQVLTNLVAEFTESPIKAKVKEYKSEEKQVQAISL